MRFDRSPQSAEALGPEVEGFIRYVRSLLALKRSHPGDDLLTGLCRDRTGQACGELELVSLTFQLIFAGHSTTCHLIGNGMLALLTHADQLERLKAGPPLIKGRSRNCCASTLRSS